jgi:dTDP-4-amino-4,6-dideoxygalactose transaminase
MYYLVCNSLDERTNLINFLRQQDVCAVFHYQSLHQSTYYKEHSDNVPDLPYSDYFTDHLVRLPMYYELSEADIQLVIRLIKEFYHA